MPAEPAHPLDRRAGPAADGMAAAAGFALAKRGLVFIRPYRWRIAGILGVALCLAAVTATEPLIMKRLFDSLGAADPTRQFLTSLAALVLLEIARAGTNAWLAIRTWETRIAVEYGIRERLVNRLGALPISFHRQERVGGLMTRLNAGTSGTTAAFAELAFQTLPNVAYLAISLVAMARLEWRLLLVVVAFAPMPALVGMWAAREQTSRERRLLQQWTRVFARFHEVLSGMLTVKGFAMEKAEQERFLSGVREGHAIVRAGLRRDARTDVLRGMAATLARLTALGVGGWLIVNGRITIGTLVAFLGYISGLFGPVQGLTNTYQTMRKGAVALETVFGILDADDACADLPDAVAPETITGAVTFDDVGFRYAPDAPAVLDGVTLAVKPGEMIALVGPSGSG
ncbi:MAG: ABC transporter ATP-binding protein/permease, partial [Gemmatimonadota bacterium]|nr:ABC transporter ATP-binding protein/permease [Gemmatimonadota bacterium]